MIPRHLETLFCDDIRQETSGKLTLVGTYGSHLLVNGFPATLPKLCLCAKVVAPADQPIGELSLRILRGQEEWQRVEMQQQDLDETNTTAEGEQDSQPANGVRIYQFVLVFSPVTLEAPGVLRVEAQTEAETLPGVGLTLSQNQ